MHYLFLGKAIMDFTNDLHKPQLRSSVFWNVGLLNKDSTLTTFGSEIREGVTLLEFYFVGCPACEKKHTLIDSLQLKLNNEKFKVMYICMGNITDFNRFLEHSSKFLRNQSSYYVPAKSAGIFPFSGFPTEILMKGNEIIQIEKGLSEDWLAIEYEIINNHLYRNKVSK